MKRVTLYLGDSVYEKLLDKTQEAYVLKREELIKHSVSGRVLSKKNYFKTPEGQKKLEEAIAIGDRESEYEANLYLTLEYDKYVNLCHKYIGLYGKPREYGGTIHREEIENILSKLLEKAAEEYVGGSKIQRPRIDWS